MTTVPALPGVHAKGRPASVDRRDKVADYDVNDIEGSARTPQAWGAALSGEVAFETFVASGFDVNRADMHGRTSVFGMAQVGDANRELEILVKASGCDVHRADRYGWTPVFTAARNGHAASLKILVKAPGCDVNRADKYGITPVFAAARWGHAAVLKILVEVPGCDVNRTDKYGWTPVFVAARWGHAAVLKILVKAPGFDEAMVVRHWKMLKSRSLPESSRIRYAAAINAVLDEDVTRWAKEKVYRKKNRKREKDNRKMMKEIKDRAMVVEEGGDSEDWEVDRCQCIHCLALGNAAN
jgi:hypothetical protein